MITGKTLPELAQEVSITRDRARDYRVNTSSLEMTEQLTVRLGDTGINVKPRELFHEQLAERLQIPLRYYKRMQADAPQLLQRNANHWLRATPEKRLLRTLNPIEQDVASPFLEGRAFLSSTYLPLDNYDLMAAIVPPLLGTGLEVRSSQLTESKLYLQCVSPKLVGEVKKGDVVNLGLVVSNSEVGGGALSIRVLVYRLACLNGLIVTDDMPGFRRVHIGAEFQASDDILTEDTRKLRDAAIWSQARDVITAAASQATLDKVVERLSGIAQVQLANPEKAVELVAKKFDLAEAERNEVMRNLISGGDVSQYGLVNAITSLANGLPNYDRAVDIESIGGRVMALPSGTFAGNN